jgi:RHS repeat-associated protein
MMTGRRYPIRISFVLLLTLGACGGERPEHGGDPPAASETTTVKRSNLLSNGSACAAGSECTSGFCADGFCCNAACVGECVACNVAGSAGTCLPASNGTTCSDGNRCTSSDYCQAGTCLPGPTYICTAPEQEKYVSVIDLGSAQGSSWAGGINNSSVVVGMDGNRGFRWSASEGMDYVPGAPAQINANAINDAGVISVSAVTTMMLPCRYDPSVDTQPVCQSIHGSSSGINAAGTVTGWILQPIPQMFRLDAGSIEILPSVPDPVNPLDTVGSWIDGRGTVVGRQYGYGAVRYMDGRGPEVLEDLLPSGNGWNYLYHPSFIRSDAMLGSGEILGWGAWSATQRIRAFRIKTNATGDVTAIDKLPMPAPYLDDAWEISASYGSNASGKIVGSILNGSMTAYEAAFVYTDVVGSVDLNPLIDPQSGWTLLGGWAINDHDEVVGYGTHNGVYRAFMLTLPDLGPCPPPDSCHLPGGTRNILTGVCSYPAKPDGTACNDSLACTQSETCQAGVCQPPSPARPVVLNLPVENLGSLGIGGPAFDINAAGTVVGKSLAADWLYHAWRWSGTGPMVSLEAQLPLGTPSSAQAINDAGTIVGFHTLEDGAHAFRHGAAGFEDLGNIGDNGAGVWVWGQYVQGTLPYDINNAGDFVGFYTREHKVRGFRYTEGVGIEDVGTLADGGTTYMASIADSGTAVGNSWTVAGDPWSSRAVLFENPIVGLRDLNVLIDDPSWTLVSAAKINGNFIVGTGLHNGVTRTFRLHRSSGVVDEISGGWVSEWASGVNAAGDVVGEGFPDAAAAAAGVSAAFVYTDQLGFKKLDDLIPQGTWGLRGAYSINDAGAIVGYGYPGGYPRAFRLDASPQAAACGQGPNACGGTTESPICVWAEGVVDLGGGEYAAIFGYQNAGTTSVHPTTNQLLVDGAVATNPPLPPPAVLMPGSHPAAYVPKVAGGHTIAWSVEGKTATLTAPAPGTTSAMGTRVLPAVPIGTNGVGVMIDGVLVTIRTDTGPPADPTVQDDPAVDDDPFNGALAGQLSVTPTGAAVYTVPIMIPPGIAGMAPNLSLVYNSQGGNGLAGQGWELSGLSVIHRCPKTVVQDGYNRAVHMNGLEPDPANPQPEGSNQDGVCIDGKRLFQRTVSPRTYQTEGEDFTVTTRFYDNPGSPTGKATYFTVVTKSGETRFYGSSPKSRVRFPIEEDDIGSGGDEIAIWALDRVVDAWGNYYDVRYNEQNGVEQADFAARGLIVTSIHYTGHYEGARINPRDGSSIVAPEVPPFTSVKFTYENRNDVRTTRFRKAALRRNQRLMTITTDAGRYTLSYVAPGDPMLPSRLSSIGYCATPSSAFPSGQCLKSLDFTWDGGGYEWVRTPSFDMPSALGDSPSVSRGSQLVDLDGDGRVDFVSYAGFSDAENPVGAWRNTGSGWESQPGWHLPAQLSELHDRPASTMFADMDGDGLLDLVGSQYACSEENSVPGGDGRMCHQFPTKVWLNRIKQTGTWQHDTGFNNGPLAPLATLATLNLNDKDTLADLNRDGRADLIHLGPGPFDISVYYNLPGGWSEPVPIGGIENGLDQGIIGGNGVQSFHWADVNRDGYPDIVNRIDSGSDGTYYLYLGLNPTGKVWGRFQDTIPHEFAQDPQIADVDGDGRHDRVIGFHFFTPSYGLAAGAYTGAALATGLGYEYGVVFDSLPPVVSGTSSIATLYWASLRTALGYVLYRHFNLPDLNGDGLADLVVDYTGVSSAPASNFFINTGSTWTNPVPPTTMQNVPLVPHANPGTTFVDLDGDGILDVVQSWKGHPKQTFLNKFTRPILKHFPNGLAQPTDVEYAVITTNEARQQGIYTDPVPTSLEPGTQYLAMPLNVVSSVSRDDGRGSLVKPKTSYRYASLRNSASGRGPQGFGSVTVIEPGDGATLGTTTNTTFAQVYPYTGLPLAVTRFKGTTPLTVTGTNYCDTIDKNACLPNAGKIYPPKTSVFVYPSKVIDSAFQFNGTQIAGLITTTSEFTHDSHGNPTVVSVMIMNSQTGETNQKVTTNVYGTTVSLDGPRLGKVTKTTVESQRLAPADGNSSPRVHVTEFDYSKPNGFLLPMAGVNQARSTLALFRTRVEPATITMAVSPDILPPDMPDYIAQHTAFEYDEFGNVITTTACASDFGSCLPGAVNPSDASDPAHPPFRTTRVSYDPADFNAPVGPGLTQSLSYGFNNYTGIGRFPVMATNAAGHKEYSAYDPVKGVLLQKTGPNGIHSCTTYDDLGHERTLVEHCGTANLTTNVSQHLRSNGDPTLAAVVTVTRPPSGATTWVYRDVLGRPVVSRGRSFAGGFTESFSTYDSLGRVAVQSKPFIVGDPQYVTTSLFDAFGRIDSVQEALGQIDDSGNAAVRTTDTSYLPSAIRSDQVVAGLNQHRIQTKNVLGKVAFIKDSRDVTITYWYDADGNLTDAGDPATHVLPTVHVDYDLRGRKIRLVDPDVGTWHYAYNAFGDLISQTDAKGQRTTMTYDVLGRMRTKTDPQGTATWLYDVATGAGLGKLAAMISAPASKLNGGACPVPYDTAPDEHRAAKWFTYTAKGDVDEVFDCVDGDVFSTKFEYDTLGRQETVTYPTVNGSRLAIGYHYTSLGYLHYVFDRSDNTIYWAATAVNALGQLTGEYTHNGVETIKKRNPSTGWLMGSSSTAHLDGNATIQLQGYSYDEAGNVRSRLRGDPLAAGPTVETFGYDELNRMTSARVQVGSYDATESYLYDDLGIGNIKSKSGKDYSYTGCNAGPHAVCSVGSETYGYDANGNLTGRAGGTVTYNPLNKPVQITGEQGVVDFVYGADGHRVLQEVLPAGGASSSARTAYVGLGPTGRSLYERTARGDGSTEHVQFIYAGSAHEGSAFAVRVTTGSASSSSTETKYYHFDHLGSVTAQSGENGRVTGPDAGGGSSGLLSYDPWGARRSPDGRPASSTSVTLQPGHREYTGHETIPQMGLVNMNGRVYDPAIGRFLSPDPTVQSATDLQSYNRYSYVLNNPMRSVDPTGYTSREVTGSVDISTSEAIKLGLTVVQAVACAYGPATCTAANMLNTMWTSTTMLANGASFQHIVLVDAISIFAGFVGDQVGGAVGAQFADKFAGAVMAGAISGAVNTTITTMAQGGDLGVNVLFEAAKEAMIAAVRASRRGSKLTRGQDGGSGAARVEQAEMVEGYLQSEGYRGIGPDGDAYLLDPTAGDRGPLVAMEGKVKLGIGAGLGVGGGISGFVGVEFNLKPPYDLSIATDYAYFRGVGANLTFGSLSTGRVTPGSTQTTRLNMGIGPLTTRAPLSSYGSPGVDAGLKPKVNFGGGFKVQIETIFQSRTAAVQPVDSWWSGFSIFILNGMR